MAHAGSKSSDPSLVRRCAAGKEARPADQRQSHQELLAGDPVYRQLLDEDCEVCNPVEMLWHVMYSWDKRAIKHRKRYYPADLVDALSFYGARVILGKGLADLVQVLVHFPWDRIYPGRPKLGAICGLEQEYSSKQLTRLLRPWCFWCTTGPPCAPGKHEWKAPLFFPETRGRKTYWRPNEAGWEVLLLGMIDQAGQRGGDAELKREARLRKQQESMARARELRW